MARAPIPRARVAALALMAALGLGAAACDAGGGKGEHGGKGDRGGKGKRGRGPGGEEDEGQAMQVKVVHLRPAPIERWYRSSGTLEARRSAELVAVQAAIIEKILVDEGDQVKEGQLLARLDGRALDLQADAAKIELQNLEAELERLESAGAVISQEEIDKQRYLVEEARASAKVSRHQAKQTVIRAPFDGTIVTRYVDEGNLATTATPLFHLADLEVLELPLHLPEKDAASVGVGADVEVELVDGTSFTAKIERRAPVVDPLTGTVKFTMRATEAPPAAVPGAFARARVLVDRRDATPSLPLTAVFEVEDVPHVFVVQDGKASRREVKLGLEGSERVEILAGLRPEDAVVEEGNAGITEGMPLRPVEAEAEAEVASAEAAPAATPVDAGS
ncbi:MAG: efflux RND transporter periplasmic adaptor subunit [Myxococcales bacterium]|nr:efflux RND transporter periplasmic adaptor subunit [Myxococcales bacterium]